MPVKDAPRIFLGYARDDQEAADWIRRALVKEGVEVWSDQDLNAGDDLFAGVQKEINEADVVLLMLSKTALRSPWLWHETAAAVAAQVSESHQKRVIPVLLDRQAELPPLLERFNYLDLTDPETREQGIERLVEAIKQGPPQLGVRERLDLEEQLLSGETAALRAKEDNFRVWMESKEERVHLAFRMSLAITMTVVLLLAGLVLLGLLDDLPATAVGALIGALAATFSLLLRSR